MNYFSVSEIASRWGVSERTVRNYCATGRIPGVLLKGKTWHIPESALHPQRANKKDNSPRNLLEYLRVEKNSGVKGGIYHKIQIELTYNSNHIEGSRLTHEQTRYIYETNTIGITDKAINVDDIVETVNHFKCINMIIEQASQPLSEAFIKRLHLVLKNGTSDSRKDWFAVGEYKKFPNEVGGHATTPPQQVRREIRSLLQVYNRQRQKSLEDLLEFHHAFESIHPFQDGNGRVGRLILFKECLHSDIVPFIIDEELKLYYYRGLHEWLRERGYLRDTCLTAQDKFKAYMDYFQIPYKNQE